MPKIQLFFHLEKKIGHLIEKNWVKKSKAYKMQLKKKEINKLEFLACMNNKPKRTTANDQ